MRRPTLTYADRPTLTYTDHPTLTYDEPTESIRYDAADAENDHPEDAVDEDSPAFHAARWSWIGLATAVLLTISFIRTVVNAVYPNHLFIEICGMAMVCGVIACVIAYASIPGRILATVAAAAASVICLYHMQLATMHYAALVLHAIMLYWAWLVPPHVVTCVCLLLIEVLYICYGLRLEHFGLRGPWAWAWTGACLLLIVLAIACQIYESKKAADADVGDQSTYMNRRPVDDNVAVDAQQRVRCWVTRGLSIYLVGLIALAYINKDIGRAAMQNLAPTELVVPNTHASQYTDKWIGFKNGMNDAMPALVMQSLTGDTLVTRANDMTRLFRNDAIVNTIVTTPVLRMATVLVDMDASLIEDDLRRCSRDCLNSEVNLNPEQMRIEVDDPTGVESFVSVPNYAALDWENTPVFANAQQAVGGYTSFNIANATLIPPPMALGAPDYEFNVYWAALNRIVPTLTFRICGDMDTGAPAGIVVLDRDADVRPHDPSFPAELARFKERFDLPATATTKPIRIDIKQRTGDIKSFPITSITALPQTQWAAFAAPYKSCLLVQVPAGVLVTRRMNEGALCEIATSGDIYTKMLMDNTGPIMTQIDALGGNLSVITIRGSGMLVSYGGRLLVSFDRSMHTLLLLDLFAPWVLCVMISTLGLGLYMMIEDVCTVTGLQLRCARPVMRVIYLLLICITTLSLLCWGELYYSWVTIIAAIVSGAAVLFVVKLVCRIDSVIALALWGVTLTGTLYTLMLLPTDVFITAGRQVTAAAAILPFYTRWWTTVSEIVNPVGIVFGGLSDGLRWLPLAVLQFLMMMHCLVDVVLAMLRTLMSLLDMQTPTDDTHISAVDHLRSVGRGLCQCPRSVFTTWRAAYEITTYAGILILTAVVGIQTCFLDIKPYTHASHMFICMMLCIGAASNVLYALMTKFVGSASYGLAVMVTLFAATFQQQAVNFRVDVASAQAAQNETMAGGVIGAGVVRTTRQLGLSASNALRFMMTVTVDKPMLVSVMFIYCLVGVMLMLAAKNIAVECYRLR